MPLNFEIDNVDFKILEILMKNAKKPYTEVAKQVFVSGGTVHVRMKKLEDAGIVKGTTLEIDPTKLGYDITAFIGIFLAKSELYDDVIRQLKEIPEIINVHYTTGNYSMFARIHCKDTQHLKDLLHDKIQKVDGIVRTDTMISLEESINRHISLT
uniref:Lrp/AsnC ligand binding domain-containing protein n=1 Tax=Fulvivirga sp. TaxID=1931237 RepID=UPI00404A9D3B